MLTSVERGLSGLYGRLSCDWRLGIDHVYGRVLSIGIGSIPNPVVGEEELEATKELSVVVAVHNAPEEAARCLRSLERFSGAAEIILVDDGSTDARARRLVREYASRNAWQMVRNDKSSWHSGACMSGAALATRPILCLLNSDTVVTQHAWALCVDSLLRDESLKAVGPRTSDGWKSQNDIRARRCRYVWSDPQIFWYAERLYRRNATRAARQIKPFVTGAVLFVRRADWDRVGGFAGCREHVGNDVDLCLKLTAGGGWIGVCDGAYVHHLGGRSAAVS